jgi:hypothetical protein
MRRSLVASAVLLAACCALVLSGCDFAAMSVFPDYLPLLQKTRDLSQYVGNVDLMTSRLDVLSAGGPDRLFLTIWRPDKPARLLVLDEDLKVLADRDEDGLRLILGVATTGNLGSTLMVDANGNYVAGNFVMDSATLTPLLSTSDKVPGTPSFAAGVAHITVPAASGVNYLMWVDNSTDPALLQIQKRDAAWSSPSSFSVQLAPQAWSLSLQRVVRTYVNPETYFLVFGSYSNVIILAVAAADFEGGYLTQPLISVASPVYPWFVIQNARAETAWFTTDGFVVRTNEGERQLWGEGGLRATYDPREHGSSDADEAYSPLGANYYRFDRQLKTLSKLNVWW